MSLQMLLPMVDTPALFPVLDESRQRLNILKRFDWCNAPPSESTALEDVAKPDWDRYKLALQSLRAREVGLFPISERSLIDCNI